MRNGFLASRSKPPSVAESRLMFVSDALRPGGGKRVDCVGVRCLSSPTVPTGGLEGDGISACCGDVAGSELDDGSDNSLVVFLRGVLMSAFFSGVG